MIRAVSLLALVGCQSAVTSSGAEDALGVTSIFIDSAAPVLVLDPSAHAAWVPDGPHTFVGTVSDADPDVSVSVDGQPAEVSAEGVFTVERVLRPGAHTFTVVAEDTSGNATSRSVTMFAGTAEPLGRLLRGAAEVEVSEAVLGAAVDVLAADIAEAGILTAGEAFSPFGGCVAIDSVIEDVVAGEASATVETDAVAQVMYLDISVEHLSLDFSGTADVCGVPEPFTGGYAVAEGASVRLTLSPSVESGLLVTTLDRVDVDFAGVTVELPELIGPLADSELTVNEIGVAEAFARAFEQPFADRDAAAERIGDLIFGMMPAVGLDGQRFVEGGVALDRVAVSGRGLSARYLAHHAARGPAPMGGAPAAWLPLAGAAPPPALADASVAVSVDVFNHALTTAWWGGAFTRHVEVDVGDDTTISAELRPALPPLVEPTSGGLAVSFGEIYVTLSEKDAPTRTLRLFADLRMGTTLERGRFDLTVDTLSGDAPEPAIEDALRSTVFEVLDAALPDVQEPGWLNGGEQLSGPDPVVTGPQQGWLQTELSINP